MARCRRQPAGARAHRRARGRSSVGVLMDGPASAQGPYPGGGPYGSPGGPSRGRDPICLRLEAQPVIDRGNGDRRAADIGGEGQPPAGGPRPRQLQARRQGCGGRGLFTLRRSCVAINTQMQQLRRISTAAPSWRTADRGPAARCGFRGERVVRSIANTPAVAASSGICSGPAPAAALGPGVGDTYRTLCVRTCDSCADLSFDPAGALPRGQATCRPCVRPPRSRSYAPQSGRG